MITSQTLIGGRRPDRDSDTEKEVDRGVDAVNVPEICVGYTTQVKHLEDKTQLFSNKRLQSFGCDNAMPNINNYNNLVNKELREIKQKVWLMLSPRTLRYDNLY